jgi:homoserine kinase
MNEIKIFCPQPLLYICGFDVLKVWQCRWRNDYWKSDQKDSITKIRCRFAFRNRKNVAGVALAMLKHWIQMQDLKSEIYKNIKAGSGIGSSAASSAGAVLKSMNARSSFWDQRFGTICDAGEKLVRKCHADNVAPALWVVCWYAVMLRWILLESIVLQIYMQPWFTLKLS